MVAEGHPCRKSPGSRLAFPELWFILRSKSIKALNNPVEIVFNKRKLLPLVGGALLFVLASVGMLWAAMQMRDHVFIKLFLFTVAIVGISFFGLIAIVFLPSLFIRKAGLVIAEEGLWDHSSGLSAGFVPWGDIKKVNYTFSGNNTFMVLVLKKPDKFINKQANPIRKLAMHLNYRMSGSPVHILVSVLDTDLHTLNELIAVARTRPYPVK